MQTGDEARTELTDQQLDQLWETMTPEPIINIMNRLYDAMKAIEANDPEPALDAVKWAMVNLEKHIPPEELKRLNAELDLQLTMAGSQRIRDGELH
jgi:hypothetical protein